MKKVLVLFLMVVTIFVAKGTTSVEAAVNELASLEDMGTYTITEPVMTRVRVYVNEEQVDFVESTGKTVYTQETRHYIIGIYVYSTYKYYFYEDKYVDVVVEQKQLYNDIDTLIFMISELEDLADDYGCNDTKNCVLGYVRGINLMYYNYYGFDDLLPKWEILAGKVDLGFVNYVDSHDGVGVEFCEYFAQFLPFSDNDNDGHNDNYNSAYGYVSDYYKEKEFKLVDPLDSYNSPGIDLTHMFASMDGIYENTGFVTEVISLGNDDHQKDLASWLGDLHTFTKKLYDLDVNIDSLSTNINVGSIYSNVNVDFCEWVNVSNCSFPEDDMLADIDAMNIMKFFGDLDENSISNSLSAYYNIIRDDNSRYPNRYKMFIESATIEIEFSSSSSESSISKFKKEVYYSLNTKEEGYELVNYYRYVPYMYEGFALLRGSFWPTQGDYPTFEYREYTANLFVDYVLAMASAPYYYY